MILTVIQLLLFFVGCVLLALVIVLLLVKLLDKGLDALAEHLNPNAVTRPLNTSDHIGYDRADSKSQINFAHIWVYFHKAFDEVHHKLIVTALRNSLLKKDLGRLYGHEYCHEENNTTSNKYEPRYSERLVPIKHLATIVNWLRRSVNQ